MSKTAGLAALLVIFSAHAALSQDDSTRMRSLTVTGAQPASPPAGLSQSADSAAADTAGAAKTTTSGSQHATVRTAHTSSKGNTSGTSGASGASGAGAGIAADAYGRDRWDDNRWRDDRWRDDRWGDRPAGGIPGANAQGGLPAGFKGANLPDAARAQGVLPAQGALPTQGGSPAQGAAAAGALNGNGFDRDYWDRDRDRDYRRPYYPDNVNAPGEAGGFSQSDIAKMMSGQGLPTGR